MRLWQKISLFTFLFTLIITEIILYLILPRVEKEIVSLHGEKLKAIAATAAANIEGDEYEKLNFKKQSIVESGAFKKYRKKLLDVKRNLNLSEDLYTVNLIDTSKAIFGVMTNKSLFAGDTLHIKAKEALDAYKRVKQTIDCSFTNLYMDQYGSWISGMAPILNSQNKVVGIVQADYRAESVYAKIDQLKRYIYYVQLISIPFILLLSGIISKFTTRPIAKVIDRVDKLSNGDYSKPEKISSGKDVKKLDSAVNRLRETIIEQQEKIFHSINELKIKNMELEKAKERAEASDRLKSEFLAMISHEVRTPLNVILGYLSMIESEIDISNNDEIKGFFKTIHKSADRLIRTIELIIITSQLQTGTYDFIEEDVDLEDILSQIKIKFNDEAKCKGNELHVEINTTKTRIKGNEILINKLIENLVENAIIFTEDGKIEIELKETTGSFPELCIRDTGIGISEEFQKKMFEPFEQENSGYSRKYDGNGLGLTLVKQVCNYHQFYLDWNSEKNKGTEFKILFGSPSDLRIANHESYKLKNPA
ncbi:MAG: sensor histidine kinase [Ignavibacteria bacterium]|nr:MAG: sensor histidine kinase [Ignavibacteria bacterium]